MKSKLFNTLMILVLALSFSTTGFAQEGGFQPGGALNPDSSYSNDVAKEDLPGMAMAARSFRLASVIVTFDGPVDADRLAASVGGQVVHRYEKVFNGASMLVPPAEVADISRLAGVEKVYLDELLKPDTDASPQFIGAPTVWNALGGQESAGEGVVVGVLDTGIWPEHPSFSDPDPSGKPYAPPAVVPGSHGFIGAPRSTCDFGNSAYNPNDAPFACNNKLIGAYTFLDTYKALVGLTPGEFDSARDAEGHGTHTTSTAAGNANVAATLLGVDRGLVSGIAPRAQVIMYRVCGLDGCYSSDSAAAVEQSILDQVDALNFSIGGGTNPYADAVSLAFLNAYENGIFVAASAGNSGPTADTTGHREPWVTTAAASTSDRGFVATLTLYGDNGDTLDLTGATVTAGISTPTAVVMAADYGNNLCLPGVWAPGTFSGQIVVCQRGTNARVEKSFVVEEAGGSGMILYNASLLGINTDSHFIPSIHIEMPEGNQMLAFLAGHTGVTATFTEGVAMPIQGDVITGFSSRGGPGQTLGVSKPDITAPGIQILAGMTPLPSTVEGGKPGELFQAIAGTSMSSPHIAGSGALIKALHPDWTPGQIKSALMTTAFGVVFKEDGVTPATPFDTGSGRVDLNKAGNPGLTFDESGADYVTLQNQLWNSNYPSLYHPVMPGIITVERTVTSVLNKAVKWNFSVEAPADLKVTPSAGFRLNPGASHTFSVTVDASAVPLGQVRHATLFLSAAVSNTQTITLRFPITILRKQPVLTLTKVCDPATIGLLAFTNCAITARNTGFADANISIWDTMPKQLSLVAESVTGGSLLASNKVGFTGTLAGAQPPEINVAVVSPASTPAGGYLPLSAFGIAPISGVGDETITNFNVPSFKYGSETYSRLGIVSDGYVVVGGGTSADVQYINQMLPNATPPNNVLAPFWTDLNPAFGGALRIGVLTDGVNSWIIVDFAGVANYGNRAPNTFQVWIQTGATEDITFTYGAVTTGDGGFLTVGAENRFGNRGGNIYYNGNGTPPGPTMAVRVTSAAPTPGETHVLGFRARGSKPGAYRNCAYMTSNLFQGTSVACFDGSVASGATGAAK